MITLARERGAGAAALVPDFAVALVCPAAVFFVGLAAGFAVSTGVFAETAGADFAVFSVACVLVDSETGFIACSGA